MKTEDSIAALPYTTPFCFVDSITAVTDTHIEGYHFFKEDAWYYKGHFKDRPVTPGVLLTECMAQIGLVCLGIYKVGNLQAIQTMQVGLTHNTIEFLKPVFPNTKIIIKSDLQYFRFNKLKCKVKAYFEDNTVVAQGEISGIFKKNDA